VWLEDDKYTFFMIGRSYSMIKKSKNFVFALATMLLVSSPVSIFAAKTGTYEPIMATDIKWDSCIFQILM